MMEWGHFIYHKITKKEPDVPEFNPDLNKIRDPKKREALREFRFTGINQKEYDDKIFEELENQSVKPSNS